MVRMVLHRHTSSKQSMLYWLELVLEWHHLPPYYRALLASKNGCNLLHCTYHIIENFRYRSVRQVCPRCTHGWTGDIPSSVMRLRKVYNFVRQIWLYYLHGNITIGWFFLDKSRPTLLWMVCQSVNKPWDWGERTRAKWLWAIPWLSLVHDISTAQNWHESNWSPDGFGSHPQERESWSHYWLED